MLSVLRPVFLFAIFTFSLLSYADEPVVPDTGEPSEPTTTEPIESSTAETSTPAFVGTLQPSNFYAYDDDESVNTYTGALYVHHEDLRLPGNGGLDIVVNRVYQTDIADENDEYHWLIHPGRVVEYDMLGVKHHVLIDGVGNAHELYGQLQYDTFVSADGWYGEYKAVDGVFGFVLTAPDGAVYTYKPRGGVNVSTLWDLSRVEDVHGNWLEYTYERQANGGDGLYPLSRIHASDGRVVDFNDGGGCIAGNHDTQCMRVMTANGQTWRYEYHSSACAGYGYCLTRVERPDGTQWAFEYELSNVAAFGNTKKVLLSRTTLPQGGYSAYTWMNRFDALNAYTHTPAVSTRTLYNADATLRGTWTHTLSTSTLDPYWQKHTITGPGKTVEYHHYNGIWNGQLWELGTLQRVFTYGDGVLLSEEQYEWFQQQISSVGYSLEYRDTSGQDYLRGDTHTYAPRLSHKTSLLGGRRYETQWDDFDIYGNSKKITEQDFDGYERQLDLTYFENATRRIHSLWKTVTVAGELAASRDFNDLGELTRESHFGMGTDFTYNDKGDLATRTDAQGHMTQYSNYRRGTARIVILADGNRVTRTVNDTGTLASETDARGYTTSYQYDGLNRVIETTYPRGAVASVVYNGTAGVGGSVLTRGNYEKTTLLDDFGHVQTLSERDVTTGDTRRVDYAYDAWGREVFHSYPSAAQSSYGVYTDYDALDRVVKERFPYTDAAQRTYAYPNANETRYTDARGNETVTRYRVYGDPSQRDVMAIDSPEAITTVYERDSTGHVLSITQGGVERRYTLDEHKFVKNETNPETGLTQYTYDADGKVKTKQVGNTAPITYTYDERDWLREMAYPNETVTWDYDANGNVLRVSNTQATLTYTYDGNGNQKTVSSSLSVPASEAIIQMIVSPFTVEAPTTQTLTYNYDDLDHLAAMTYPSGHVIDYNPNALGKATQVGSLLSTVHYNSDGQLESLTRGNGITEGISITTYWHLPMHQSSSINDIDYTYDDARNVKTITDHKDSDYALSLTYDGLERVALVQDNWGAGAFDYDGMNNLKLMRYGDCSTQLNYNNALLQSSTGCHPFTYSYDARGNLTSKASPTGEALTLTFDAASHLRGVTGTGVNWQYDYDGLGEQVRKDDGTTVTTTLYDPAGKRLVETTGTQETEYYYLGEQVVASNKRLLATENDPGQTTYYHWDVLGNTIAASDASGQLLWRKAYQVFGLDIRGQSTDSTTPGFVNKAYNRDTGLTYFGQRYYAPVLGRFVSIDPEPVQAEDIWTFNRYLYGRNNPYKFKDVEGQFPVLALIWAGASIAATGYDAYTSYQTGGWSAAGKSIARDAGISAVFGGAGKLVSKGYSALKGLRAAESVGSDIAHSVNAQKALSSKLSGLEKAQNTAARTRELADGRIRYYTEEVSARSSGPTRGASFATEFNPSNGNVRQWMESYDHAGSVIRVHPKSINGQTLNAQHYPPTGRELLSWGR